MAVLEAVDELDSSECAAVVQRALDEIRRQPALRRLATLPDTELTGWCTKAEQGLQMWVAGRESAAVNMIYYDLGRSGAVCGLPLSELVAGLLIVLREGRRQTLSRSASGKPELSDPLATFCDYARYYAIRGYEDALR